MLPRATAQGMSGTSQSPDVPPPPPPLFLACHLSACVVKGVPNTSALPL